MTCSIQLSRYILIGLTPPALRKSARVLINFSLFYFILFSGTFFYAITAIINAGEKSFNY